MRILHIDTNMPEIGLGGLLPRESYSGVAFSLEEQERISLALARLYQTIIHELGDRLSSEFSLPPDVITPFVRSGVVPLVHFFMDRLLRTVRVSGGELAFVCSAPADVQMPNSIEQFCIMAMHSRGLNQWLLCAQAPIVGLGITPVELDLPDRVDQQAQGAVNHNNAFTGGWLHRKWVGVRKRVSRRFGKYPAMNLALLKQPLAEAGAFGWGKLADVDYDWELKSATRNEALRQRVFEPGLVPSRAGLREFFAAVDVDDQLVEKTAEVMAKYFSELYPTQLLEGIPINLPIAVRQFERFRKRPFLIGDVNFSTEGSYFRAAAKALGSTIIGCQHGGGNYGYIRDYSVGIEGEFAQCDKFVSWGWSRLPQHPALQRTETVPMPSPWLAYRSRHWKDVLGSKPWENASSKQYDVLFMPHRIYPFPPAPSGAAISTTDHIKAYGGVLKTFVAEAKRSGVSVLHKPYNQITADLLHATRAELEILGDGFFRELPVPGKGLSKPVLEQCHVVVWDQPGGGFLECLASKIPTLVLWPRHFNQESTWARDAFERLASVGLVHRSADTLMREVIEFKRSPGEWMEQPARVRAIEEFTRQYAWNDRNWVSIWQGFIESLS